MGMHPIVNLGTALAFEERRAPEGRKVTYPLVYVHHTKRGPYRIAPHTYEPGLWAIDCWSITYESVNDERYATPEAAAAALVTILAELDARDAERALEDSNRRAVLVC